MYFRTFWKRCILLKVCPTNKIDILPEINTILGVALKKNGANFFTRKYKYYYNIFFFSKTANALVIHLCGVSQMTEETKSLMTWSIMVMIPLVTPMQNILLRWWAVPTTPEMHPLWIRATTIQDHQMSHQLAPSKIRHGIRLQMKP